MRTADVGVIGAGAWGTALALAFARAGRRVTLWGRDADAMHAMARERGNPRLPGIVLPEGVSPVADLAHAAQAPVLVLAVPAQVLRAVGTALALVLTPGRAVIAAAKGVERDSGHFMSEVMADVLGPHRYGVLSGPSFAADVAKDLPTALVLAMQAQIDAQVLAAYLGSPMFRLYHSTDLRGVEIGGAAKNVLAIAAGIVSGMDLGESARAAIIARSFAELRRFAQVCGGQPETLMGLSGLGDLLLTASSLQSRNFALGHALGRGKPPGAVMAGALAEGAHTAPVLHEMARARGIDMPIVAAVTEVLAGQRPDETLRALIARPFRAE